MKRLIYLFPLFISLLVSIPAKAVTEKEMDQARALAAQAYLRYANDGSGYLDNIHPKSMSQLERALKTKEKENIKAFKNIPVPSDYASWDKQKLVDYWGVKAFAASGLLQKGRVGKGRAKKNISAMKISEPVKTEKTVAKPAATTAKPAQDKQEAAKPAQTPADAPESESKTDSSLNVSQETSDTTAPNLDNDKFFADLEEETQIKKAEDHTWIYILILCILVAVVVALVVFASNVMKRNEARLAEADRIHDDNLTPSADSDKMREKFAAAMATKNEELATLSQKIESLNSLNTSLKVNIQGLTAEVVSLRTRLSEANARIRSFEEKAAGATPQAAPVKQQSATTATPASTVPTRQTSPTDADTPAVRSIYLGRANAKGIFVRADRSLIPGNSIYRLDTTDGYAGSFRVAANQEVWEHTLRSPIELLSGACIAPNFTETSGMKKIVNDSAGTAIFEDGCWKVIRKAKIHFE